MFNSLEIKVPPLALVFLFGALMWLVSAYSVFTIALPWRSAFALMFCTVGLAIVLAGVFAFRQAKTTVNPLKPETTTAMVTSGIYRFTRNPMYVGVIATILGQALLYGSWRVGLYGFLFALWLHFAVTVIEEPHLRKTQGAVYEEYCQRVPRWFGSTRATHPNTRTSS